jgi:phosphoribosylaminoimidazolecarboxamide formyltransferase/IMP cyclohydrolase
LNFKIPKEIRLGEPVGKKYGENPYLNAVSVPILGEDGKPVGGVPKWPRLAGGELSYNNEREMSEAYTTGAGFEDRYAVFLLKHGRPCSAAWTKYDRGMKSVLQLARAPNHRPDFGNVMRVIRGVVNEDFANAVVNDEETRVFTEVMLLDAYTEGGIKILTEAYAEDKKMRVHLFTGDDNLPYEMKAERGELLLQDKPYLRKLSEEEISKPVPEDILKKWCDYKKRKAEKMKIPVGVVTKKMPDLRTIRALMAADEFVDKVPSNGIVIADCEYDSSNDVRAAWIEGAATEEARVEAVIMAGIRAGKRAKGNVLSSDGFFPYDDNVDEAAKLGIKAIIQPGGGRYDGDSIDACNAHGIPMIFTGMRRFKH